MQNGFWLPASIAPFTVVVTVTNVADAALRETGEKLAAELEARASTCCWMTETSAPASNSKMRTWWAFRYRDQRGQEGGRAGKVELVTRATGDQRGRGAERSGGASERAWCRKTNCWLRAAKLVGCLRSLSQVPRYETLQSQLRQQSAETRQPNRGVTMALKIKLAMPTGKSSLDDAGAARRAGRRRGRGCR